MNKLGSSSVEEEFRLTISRKSRKHEAVKALFWRGGDFDTENGDRCCRRSFVGLTFGPFTWPLLAEFFVIGVPPLHYHFLHDHVFWITRNLSDDSQVERISKDPSADRKRDWGLRSPIRMSSSITSRVDRVDRRRDVSVLPLSPSLFLFQNREKRLL